MPAEYVIIGGGDFAIEVVTYLDDIGRMDPAKAIKVSDIVAKGRIRSEDFEQILGTAPQVHEGLEMVERLTEKSCVIAVGDPNLRARFFAEVRELGGRLGSVIHPTAYVARSASIGDGTVVCPQAFVGPFAKVGSNCAINVHAVVGHDAAMGDCAVLSPGADINGYGSVGECGFLGAGAIINPKASLGAFGKLSAGSVLTSSTEEGFLMHGNPAKGRQMFRRP